MTQYHPMVVCGSFVEICALSHPMFCILAQIELFDTRPKIDVNFRLNKW